MSTDETRFSEYIEYTGAEEYDRENGLSGPALPFYLDLARETGGPALDLACGTGFLTIPLAESGLEATGVDLSQEMLDHGRSKAGSLPIRWLHADCRTLDLGEQFRLITLTGNAFQEFRTRADQEGLLGSVRRHLSPGGLFAFETRFPRPSELLTPEALAGDWSAETAWRKYENERGQTVAVSTQQRHDALQQTVEYVIHRRWQADGREQVHTERAVLRFVYPREMEALLHYNGLAIRDAYGDWDRRPLDGMSPRMIYVCHRRAG
ncbi:MAG TPA: class I SAM-dependent methyltransferase [Thermomicrobiales bacterium]|nr:class I SAM-dependent methyltransferase [Thermomicrobiales bacterium]